MKGTNLAKRDENVPNSHVKHFQVGLAGKHYTPIFIIAGGIERLSRRPVQFCSALTPKTHRFENKTAARFLGVLDQNKSAARILCLNFLEAPAKTPETLF